MSPALWFLTGGSALIATFLVCLYFGPDETNDATVKLLLVVVGILFAAMTFCVHLLTGSPA